MGGNPFAFCSHPNPRSQPSGGAWQLRICGCPHTLNGFTWAVFRKKNILWVLSLSLSGLFWILEALLLLCLWVALLGPDSGNLGGSLESRGWARRWRVARGGKGQEESKPGSSQHRPMSLMNPKQGIYKENCTEARSTQTAEIELKRQS